MGINIPEELSIIGFDNMPIAKNVVANLAPYINLQKKK